MEPPRSSGRVVFVRQIPLITLVSAMALGGTTLSAATDCVAGSAGAFSCEKVDLLSLVALPQMGGGSGNDLWGWTDPVTDDWDFCHGAPP